MQRYPVDSKYIKDAGYDSSSKILEIAFYSGKIYQYSNVPPLIYQGFLHSTSKNNYYTLIIKDSYPCTTIKQ